MNGRIYDPLIGRFMSADPFIQAPGMLQSHNRYAYVMNNPLNLTDPSGFSWWTRFRDKILKPVVFAYLGYLTGGLIGNQLGLGGLLGGSGGTIFATGNAALTTLGSVVAGAGGGFVAGVLSTGTLDGGLRGAFSGGVFGGIAASGAASGWGTGGYVAAHAAGGCITSVAGGGACGSGAVSAAFGKFTTMQTESLTTGLGQFAASVVAGGVGSVIAGGKFENGAVTAAFGYLFNRCSQATFKCGFEMFLNGAKAVGGILQTGAGVLICGAGGLPCVAGAPIAAIGASQVIEGVTYFQNVDINGFNPIKQVAQSAAVAAGGTENMGAAAYHAAEVASGFGALTAPVSATTGWTSMGTRNAMGRTYGEITYESTKFEQAGRVSIGINIGSGAAKVYNTLQPSPQ